MNTGKVRVLTLLYWYVVLDTTDYSVLLHCFLDWCGMSGTTLTWIHSFLANTSQSIKISKCSSETIPTFCGVSQGSVLGHLLFAMYTTPLSSLIHSHKLDPHLYPVYISLATADTNLSLTQLVDCVSDIFDWMLNNKLRLNAA